ncbi:unnamed protein product [Microthlaspi erraticum]|uniref:Uncharacterized protein n=1 Tax=Microthlaspi erraticum TaxID=1685480 RepID=A0A6D2JAV0_9BRAS|nr:unnamed protein product [Microthlaspi erraticum]CAA7040881.1 unnamed protein product [Microthlaspi erraticum]
MESSRNKTSAVMRRLRPLAGSYRYYPYTPVNVSGKKEMREEVVRLGVELSLHVARSMFLLSDDISRMLGFCYRLLRYVTPLRNPVIDRLILVMHFVYFKDIKPKKKNNGEDDCGSSDDQERVFALIRAAWKDFGAGILILGRLWLALIRNPDGFDGCQISRAIVRFKQDVLKRLDDKLEDVNGFARATLESNISDLWKSLFDVEDKEAAEVVLSRALRETFTPILGKGKEADIPGLVRIHPPYILGEDFKTEEAKEEVVRLGVELCLYVAQYMFLLCDDIRKMLRFCNRLWRDTTRTGHVLDRLLLVMHHVYTRYMEPTKIGVHGKNSVHWKSVVRTRRDFSRGFMRLSSVALSLKQGRKCGRECTRPVETTVKELEEKLGCVEKKGVAEANGFDRDAIEPEVLEIWKSLFDVEAKEATPTLQAIKDGILRDLACFNLA